MSNIVTAEFENSLVVRTDPLWQWDYGQILKIEGLELPSAVEVHFASDGSATTTTQIGTNGEVTIPDTYLTTGKEIHAFIYLHTGNSDGETEYKIVIPVKTRPQPTHETPTPVQQTEIEQALAAMEAVSAEIPAVHDNVNKLHGLFGGVTYGATERVEGGTRVLNQITADRVAAQLGFYYDTDENKLYTYHVFGKTLGGDVASTKFYMLVQSGSGEVTGEEMTYENAAHVAQQGSGVKAIYKLRYYVTNVTTKIPLVLRLCVLYFDADGNEIGRHYSAQYEYTIENGAVVRTRMQTAAQDAEIIEDIGLSKNVDGVSTTFAYIARTDFEFLPVVSTFEDTSWRFVIPDDWYDNAQFGYALCVRDGAHRVYCGPTIYKNTSFGLSDETPQPLGVASAGLSNNASRADHVHAIPSVIAQDFSASANYSFGDYVLHNGALYCFTANHAAGAWTGTDASPATIANDVRDLKSQINDLDEFCRKEVITVETGSGTATAGNSISSQTHLIDVNIANGSSYKITVDSGGCFTTFHLYANGNAIKYNCASGTEYELVAGTNITWFSIYVSGTNVTGSGTFTAAVSTSKETSNSLEERIDNLSSDVYKSEYLLEPNVVFFKSLYEVGANVNNDGNATYIYHEITFACDGKSMIGVQCDKIENATANKPIVVHQFDSNDSELKTEFFSEADGISGIRVSPENDAVKILVNLYPSSTGGLTTQTAKFYNVVIFTSNDGDYTIKQKCVPDKYAVPFYYLKNNYLQGKVDTIEGLMKAANGNYDAFIFCTDQHWTLNAKQSPKLINYICQRLKIRRMFMGGDYDNGINLNAYNAYIDAFDGRVYDTIGNHEYMNYFADIGKKAVSKTIEDGDIWAYINTKMTDASEADFGRNYYYVDNPMQKMRYIVLNVYADNGNAAKAQFEADQKTWLQNTALNLPNGYTAVIFAHYLYSVDYDTGDVTAASTTADILSVVDAYSGNGEIACLIAGHTHVDGMTTTPGGIPVFITTCDKCKPWISAGTDMEPWITENRHEGTITEQAFDVVVVNKTSKLISFVRIGAPADNGTGAKLEIRQQNYGT